MASRCWRHACSIMCNEDVMSRLQYGINPKQLPIHISFIYVGDKLHCVRANVGSHHAEQNCIRAIHNLPRNKPVRVFVTKITGQHSMSRPCAHCTRLLNFRLPQARIYYTNHEGSLCEDVGRNSTHISHGGYS